MVLLLPAPARSAAIESSIPDTVEVAEHGAAFIQGEFAGPDSNALLLDLKGLPAGLYWTLGKQFGKRRQIHVYGVLGAEVRAGTSRRLEWRASNGAVSDTVRSTLVVRPRRIDAESLSVELNLRIRGRYHHGMSHEVVRNLGGDALPMLARMLRDDAYRDDWHKVVFVIGTLGDTAYFDTLRSFIWTRFRGPIDNSTYTAMLIAQSNLGLFASALPRALSYLIETSNASAWAKVPWVAPRGEGKEAMARATLTSLMNTDSPDVDPLFEESARRSADGMTIRPSTPELQARLRVRFAESLRSVHELVRTQGLIASWGDR